MHRFTDWIKHADFTTTNDSPVLAEQQRLFGLLPPTVVLKGMTSNGVPMEEVRQAIHDFIDGKHLSLITLLARWG